AAITEGYSMSGSQAKRVALNPAGTTSGGKRDSVCGPTIACSSPTAADSQLMIAIPAAQIGSRGAAGSLFVLRQDSIGAIPLGHVNRAIPGIASRETILHPLFSLITWFARWPCCTMQTICDCHLAGPLIARPTNAAQTWSVTSMLLNPRLLAFLAAM